MEGEQPFPTTGDFVKIRYIPNGDSQIVQTLPRKTFFSRKDPTPGRGQQAVAANFDYVFIVQSLNQDFNENRLVRYLTLALQSGAEPVVVLTKADLVADRQSYLDKARALAGKAGVYAVSAQTGEGMENLDAYLQPGKTIVFLGSSGVGKSSLVNALAGEELMQVNAVREKDDKGRHTTTHRQLILLKSGAMVIDTPGMRELGMWEVEEGLAEAFADVEKWLGQCRFRDCRHQNEPGCAVLQAIRDGKLDKKRWENYCQLEKEGQYARRKERLDRIRQEKGAKKKQVYDRKRRNAEED